MKKIKAPFIIGLVCILTIIIGLYVYNSIYSSKKVTQESTYKSTVESLLTTHIQPKVTSDFGESFIRIRIDGDDDVTYKNIKDLQQAYDTFPKLSFDIFIYIKSETAPKRLETATNIYAFAEKIRNDGFPNVNLKIYHVKTFKYEGLKKEEKSYETLDKVIMNEDYLYNYVNLPIVNKSIVTRNETELANSFLYRY